VGQAVYEKAPHLAVATPELVSAHQKKVTIEATICRSRNISSKLMLLMHFLHFLDHRRLPEKLSVWLYTFSTSQHGPADQDYTCVEL
jgi:hypothetical protein